MESIKNTIVFKFLRGRSLKTKFIKMSIILGVLFLTFLSPSFGYLAVALCAMYMALEFSADSIVWILLIGLNVPYISMFGMHMLMWEYIVILLIQMAMGIVNKKINCKDWRFITLVSLFIVLCLLLVLPLAESYKFSSQVMRLGMFATLLLAVWYIKQIKIKDILILFATSVAVVCVLFLIAKALGGGNDVLITNDYSKGTVERFSLFNLDPNFTGLALICAIVSMFILYKKNLINKYIYFGGLSVFMIFSLMTISKATCMIIGLFGLYVAIENIVISIKTKNYKHLLELVYYLGAVLVACIVCWKYVDAMFYRFSSAFDSGSTTTSSETMSNLTTGRSELWIAYVDKIFSSWQIALFGVGVTGDYAVTGTAAHCMPIEYVYRYGILSVLIMLAILVVAVMPFIKKAKVYNFMPLVIIAGMLCSLGGISARYIYVFAIQCFTLCYNGVEDENLNNAINNNDNKALNETNNELLKS